MKYPRIYLIKEYLLADIILDERNGKTVYTLGRHEEKDCGISAWWIDDIWAESVEGVEENLKKNNKFLEILNGEELSQIEWEDIKKFVQEQKLLGE